MDWADEAVLRALEDHKRDMNGTLNDLKAIVESITGVAVSRMTLSRRLRGVSTRKSSGGRPRRALTDGGSDFMTQVSDANIFCFLLFTANYVCAFCFVYRMLLLFASSARFLCFCPELSDEFLAK